MNGWVSVCPRCGQSSLAAGVSPLTVGFATQVVPASLHIGALARPMGSKTGYHQPIRLIAQQHIKNKRASWGVGGPLRGRGSPPMG
jgi:hypothetical protein